MDHFDTHALRQLIETTGDTCVSMYMPTQRKTTDFKKDPLRFKNLIVEAERRITFSGTDGNIRSRIEKLRPLVEPLFQKGFQNAVERFAELDGTGLASADFHTVLPACCNGRTEILFFGKGIHRFGGFFQSRR